MISQQYNALTAPQSVLLLLPVAVCARSTVHCAMLRSAQSRLRRPPHLKPSPRNATGHTPRQVDAAGEGVHISPLHAHIVDADLGVRHTAAVPALGVRLTLRLPVAARRPCARSNTRSASLRERPVTNELALTRTGQTLLVKQQSRGVFSACCCPSKCAATTAQLRQIVCPRLCCCCACCCGYTDAAPQGLPRLSGRCSLRPILTNGRSVQARWAERGRPAEMRTAKLCAMSNWQCSGCCTFKRSCTESQAAQNSSIFMQDLQVAAYGLMRVGT